MNTLKTLTIAAAVVLFAAMFSYNSTSAGSNDPVEVSFKGADTTDGGIKNPGGGDNPIPGR